MQAEPEKSFYFIFKQKVTSREKEHTNFPITYIQWLWNENSWKILSHLILLILK